jgi:hypothetical protein
MGGVGSKPFLTILVSADFVAISDSPVKIFFVIAGLAPLDSLYKLLKPPYPFWALSSAGTPPGASCNTDTKRQRHSPLEALPWY